MTNCRDWPEPPWTARVEEMKSGGLTSQDHAQKGLKANELPVMVGWGRMEAGVLRMHGMLRSAETAREPQAGGEGQTAAETADSG